MYLYSLWKEKQLTCYETICFKIEDTNMSYTELESGYQGLRQQNRPGFYMGHDGSDAYVSWNLYIYICDILQLLSIMWHETFSGTTRNGNVNRISKKVFWLDKHTSGVRMFLKVNLAVIIFCWSEMLGQTVIYVILNR